MVLTGRAALEEIEVFVCAGREWEGSSRSVRRILPMERAASVMLAGCGQTSIPSEGVSPAWLGTRFCTPVPTGLWLMENLEYPVQSIPQGSFPLATRRWGHNRAGEMREDRLNRWRWRAGAAPFDRPHWGSKTNVVGGIKSLAATRSSAVDDHGSVHT